MRGMVKIAMVLILGASTAWAEDALSIADYFSSVVGDRWEYRNLVEDGPELIVIDVSAQRQVGETTQFRRDENNGDHRWQSLDDRGLLVHELFFRGDVVIRYDRPAALLPAVVELGETYRVEVGYSTWDKGLQSASGVQVYETQLLRLEPIETTAESFDDCLVARTRALRTTDGSSERKGYEFLEWYARGVGPVRVRGEIYWESAPGVRTRTFRVDAELGRFAAGPEAGN